MQAYDVLKAIVKTEGLSLYDVAYRAGRSKYYLATILARKNCPRSDIMALLLDAMGYDLIARSREHKDREFVIDMPKEDGVRQLVGELSESYELNDD